ncbi:MAG: sulfite exporter TauE/SafE family protein [Hyphomicrobiaceae bacterium]
MIVGLGALAGGFVAGLAGFGTGITAMGVWLYALSPPVAATLVVVCSAASQIQTLPKIWHAVEPRRVLPFIVPGLIGVPLGTALLATVDVRTFKIGIGCLLLAYTANALLVGTRPPSNWGGRPADGMVGFLGGILGGLAGLSGPLPTMWASLRGWSKDQRRAVFQAFNLSILLAALLSHTAAGLMTRDLGLATMTALPFTFLGAWLGVIVYGRVSEDRFSKIILALLGLSGLTLIITNITG